jgi:hypothetical protein
MNLSAKDLSCGATRVLADRARYPYPEFLKGSLSTIEELEAELQKTNDRPPAKK